MSNEFYIDPSTVKAGTMKDIYDNIAKFGGDSTEAVDTNIEKEAYKAALMAALSGAKTDEEKSALGFDQDDVNAIFGLEKTETSKETDAAKETEEAAEETDAAAAAEEVKEAAEETKTTTQVVTRPPVDFSTLSKKDKKAGEEKVYDVVKEMVKNPNIFTKDAFINALKSKFANIDGQGYYIMDDNGNLDIDAKYMAAIKQVEEVMDQVDISSIRTKDEVKKYKKNVKSKLPNATKFQKHIIDKFENLAKANAITKRANEIADMFEDNLEENGNYTQSFEEAKKEAKKEDKDYTKQAARIVKKEVAKEGATQTQKNRLYTTTEEIDEQLKDTNLTSEQRDELIKEREIVEKIQEQESGRGIRKVMLNAVDKSDTITRKAIKKDIKPDRKSEGIQHTVNHRADESVSYEEASKLLSDKILQKLGRNKTITTVVDGETVVKPGFMNKDGTYNFAKLSEVVGDRIELVLDRNDDDLRESEMDGLMADLKFLTGEDFSKGEIRDIVRATGRKVQHKDLLKDTPLAAIPAVTGAIAGLIGGHVARHGELVVTQAVYLTMTNTQAQEVIKQLEEEGIKFKQSAATAGKTNITILQQHIEGDPHKLNVYFGVINGLAIGTAVGVLANIIWGGNRNEKTCVSPSDYDFTNPKYTDPKLYKRYVEVRYANNPVKVAAMKAMVDRYVKEHGKEWHKYYQNDLRRAAGIGSTLNPDECRRFYTGRKVDDTPEQENCKNKECETVYIKEDGTDDVKFDFEPEQKDFAAWDDGVNGYECLQDYDKAIYTGRKNRDGKKVFVRLNNRMVKVIQAINPEGAKSEADIKNLYKMSTIAAFAKDTIEHGVDYAIAQHPELPINKQDLVNALGGCPVKGKTFTPVLYDDNGNPCNWIKPSKKVTITDRSGNIKGANISNKNAHFFKKGTEPTYWSQDCNNKRTKISEEEYKLHTQK